MDDNALDALVEAVERARYEALLGKPWEGLRPQERKTRLELGHQALETSGALPRLRALAADLAEATALLAAREAREDALKERALELDRREADVTRRTSEHVRALHQAGAAVAAAQADAAAQAARADAAEDVIRALSRASRPAHPER